MTRKKPEPEIPAYLTVREAAEALKLTPSMLYKLAAANRIPHYRYGPKTIRFAASDLQDWARAHKE